MQYARSNESFSLGLPLLAGPAVVHLCASGRVSHGVVWVLCGFGLTEQVASRSGGVSSAVLVGAKAS